MAALPKKLEDRPPNWCRSLVDTGLMNELLALESSVRSQLGSSVERQLRVLRHIDYFEKTSSEGVGTVWADKASVQHGILAFLDVIAVNESNDALSHPKAIELMTACRKKLEDSIAAVTERVNQGRKDLAPLYESMRPVMDVVLQTHDFLSDGTVIETVKSINANHDTLKDAVQGRELGGVCVCLTVPIQKLELPNFGGRTLHCTLYGLALPFQA